MFNKMFLLLLVSDVAIQLKQNGSLISGRLVLLGKISGAVLYTGPEFELGNIYDYTERR